MDARRIGQYLRDQYNMRPAAIPFKNDQGVMELGTLAPPETVHSIDVCKILGKQSVIL